MVQRTRLMNSAKLSARMTPKLCASLFQRKHRRDGRTDEPMRPSPAIGIRSPGCRNASASMAAIADSATMTIGMRAAYSVIIATRAFAAAARGCCSASAAIRRGVADWLACDAGRGGDGATPAGMRPVTRSIDALDRRLHRPQEHVGSTPIRIAIAMVGTISAHSRGVRSGSDRFFSLVTRRSSRAGTSRACRPPTG